MSGFSEEEGVEGHWSLCSGSLCSGILGVVLSVCCNILLMHSGDGVSWGWKGTRRAFEGHVDGMQSPLDKL